MILLKYVENVKAIPDIVLSAAFCTAYGTAAGFVRLKYYFDAFLPENMRLMALE